MVGVPVGYPGVIITQAFALSMSLLVCWVVGVPWLGGVLIGALWPVEEPAGR